MLLKEETLAPHVYRIHQQTVEGIRKIDVEAHAIYQPIVGTMIVLRAEDGNLNAHAVYNNAIDFKEIDTSVPEESK